MQYCFRVINKEHNMLKTYDQGVHKTSKVGEYRIWKFDS